MSNYDALSDIVKFNTIAGNKGNEKLTTGGKVDLYMNLIEEELHGKDELEESYNTADRKGMLDGAGDLIVVTAGLIHSMGVDPNEVLSRINASNLSKYCYNKEDADKSVVAYEYDERYTDVHWQIVEGVYVIFGRKVETPDGDYKILKGINFFEPDLSDL